jgi:hypothetical protein
MALPPEDLRLKFDPEDLERLRIVAEVDCPGGGYAKWAQDVLNREVAKRCHAAIVISERLASLGISGKK